MVSYYPLLIYVNARLARIEQGSVQKVFYQGQEIPIVNNKLVIPHPFYLWGGEFKW